MSIVEIKVPVLPESVTEAVVSTWHIASGSACQEGDVIAELETDKVMLEVVATAAGVVADVHVKEGDTVNASTVLASIDTDSAIPAVSQSEPIIESQSETSSAPPEVQVTVEQNTSGTDTQIPAAPSVRRAIHEQGVDVSQIQPSGRGGRILQSDLVSQSSKRVPMSPIRKKIAERLVEAQHTAAMLTTFNEVDMQPIMALRKENQEAFTEKFGVKLGLMSFFVQAVTHALHDFPEINASVDEGDILYHPDQNIGIAVSTDRGLVVPVLQCAQNMGYHEIEQAIRDYALKAREGKITLDDMSGGTFTITNGGVFGSMLSTPILNMPQSAILGMHAIQNRAVVVDDEVVIRPMMYLALSYDHRLVDGKQSVSFLVAVKDAIENPSKILLGL